MAAGKSQQSAFMPLLEAFYDDPDKLSQLLRPCAGSQAPFQPAGLSPQKAAVSAAATTPAPAPLQLPVPSPARNDARRRATRRPRHDKPPLPKQPSAPTRAGAPLDCPPADRMFPSFGDNVVGDTQPDSQFYRDWIERGGNARHSESPGRGVSLLEMARDDEAAYLRQINLVASSVDDDTSPASTSPMAARAIETRDDTQGESNGAPTSPLKFHVATPAAARRMRDTEDEGLSSIARTATTPGSALAAAAFFPPPNGSGITNPLSLTQIFNGTQAGTSPVVGRLNEDAALQRPSPNFSARRSSPGPAYSSPTHRPRKDLHPRCSSELRGPYVTMGQSQEIRSHEAEDTDDVEPPEQDSWEEAAELERQRAKRKAKERVEQDAARTFQKVTAPALSSPVRKAGRKLSSLPSVKKVNTPRSRGRTRLSAYDGPYDDVELDGMYRSAPENAPGDVKGGVAVHSIRMKADDAEEPVQVPRTSSHPLGALSGQANRRSAPGSPSASAQLHQETQARDLIPQHGSRLSQIRNRRASFTIVDSQPEPTEIVNMPRPKNLLPSSPSTNQYSINNTTMGKTGFTSQVVSSSVPPMPPRSSSQELGAVKVENEETEDDTRVPSSPPALDVEGDADQDEVIYDEHDYDDHETVMEDDEPLAGELSENESQHGILDPGHAGEEETDEEMEVEMSAPIVEDEEDGREAIDTAGRENQVDCGENAMIRSSHSDVGDSKPAFIKSGVHHENTIPDSDMMENTKNPASTDDNCGENLQAESATIEHLTIEQRVAPEQILPAENAKAVPQLDNTNNSSVPVGDHDEELGGSEQLQFRSLSHIANLPDTQLTDIGNVEIPELPFIPEEADDPANQALIQPSARKSRITYPSRRKQTDPRSLLIETHRIMKVSEYSPLRQAEQHDEEPGSPTAERKQRGARAAANTRIEATSTSHQSKKRKLSAKGETAKPQKKARTKTAKRPMEESVKERDTRGSRAARGPFLEPNVYDLPDDHEEGVVPDRVASSSSLDELVATSPAPETLLATNNESRDNSTHSRMATKDDRLPNRVLALWPGHGYYPATCLGQAGQHRVQVCYDEGSSTDLDLGQLRSLDLQRGDYVKVDLPGMKKHTYVVIDTVDKLDHGDEDSFVSTDIHGHRSVILELKQRESLSVDERKRMDTVTVPVEKVYLTQQLFNKFRNRQYQFVPSTTRGLSTPRTTFTTETSGCFDSPSVSRRSGAGPSMLRQSIAADLTVVSSLPPESSIFFNMAFAVTVNNDQGDTDKEAFSELVTRNGGQVLDGFYELFEELETTEPVTHVKPSQKSKAKTAKHAATSLVLKDEYTGLRSAVLITDAHSRRTKYIQALALNLPCVHHRWLSDSIAAGASLPFGKYLLPAGVSTYLDPEGVIRSRNMALYDPNAENASFEEMVNNRDFLLRDQSVLLIAGKSKREMERKKPYLFLSYALGPRVIGRCSDLASAKELLKDGAWDWVNVDGDVDDLAEAERVIFGPRNGTGIAKPAPKSKRRKRRSESTSAEPEVLFRAGEIGGKKVRLVCDEFVIQSLILGDLVEN